MRLFAAINTHTVPASITWIMPELKIDQGELQSSIGATTWWVNVVISQG